MATKFSFVLLGAAFAAWLHGSVGGGDTSDCGELVCVHASESRMSVTVTAVNTSQHAPVSFWLDMVGWQADATGTGAPITLQPGEARVVASAAAGQPEWNYDYSYSWNLGPLNATHARGATYRLPFARGGRFPVSQGCGGDFSHHGSSRYAWDFAMPVGTPIHAARAGKVIDTEDIHGPGKPDESYRDAVNFVRVLHDDGTVGAYYHLRKNGIAVAPGDRVRGGDLLGWSGNSGYSSGPHLHFEVYHIDPSLRRQTVEIAFQTRNGTLDCSDRTFTAAA